MPIAEGKDFASESGHWYRLNGDACYTVEKSDGSGPRATTLRDARKLNLVPSVTTIIKEVSKPGLNFWIQKQILLAALTLPRLPREGDDEFATRIIQDSKEQAQAAALRGTELHGAIEQAINGYTAPKWMNHILAVEAALWKVDIVLRSGISERSFACADGYGGKIDYASNVAIVDFKSKDKIEDDKDYAYDEHCMQLAAYRYGLGYSAETRLINVFVGCDDCKVVLREWSQQEAERAFEMFMAILNFWKAKNNYQL